MEFLSRKPVVVSVNNYHYLRGGSERYYLSLNRLLRERGHGVLTVSTSHPANISVAAPSVLLEPVGLQRPSVRELIRLLYSAKARMAVERLVRDHRADVAHLHIYYGQLTSAILEAFRRAGIPIVHTLHEYKLICPVYTLVSNGSICEKCEGRHFWQAIPRRCNRRSFGRSLWSAVEAYVSRARGAIDGISHFIAVSDFVRKKMVKYGIPAEKIATIHNFVNYDGDARVKKTGDYFLYFGRLERTKGVFTLLEAASQVDMVPLYFVGGGEARNELERLIEVRELNHIRVLGFKHGVELDQLIQNSICTIIPSLWYEPCPMAVLESYAFGKPVIGSDIGGIPELIGDGSEGFLSVLRETRMYCANGCGGWPPIARRRRRWGLAGKKRLECQFSPEIHYEKLMSVYRKVM